MRALFAKALLLGSSALTAQASFAQTAPAATAATAQADAPAAQAEAAAEPAKTEQDIVVTARRREEKLQDVPISVSAISGDQLARSGVSDVQGLQYRTP